MTCLDQDERIKEDPVEKGVEDELKCLTVREVLPVIEVTHKNRGDSCVRPLFLPRSEWCLKCLHADDGKPKVDGEWF